MNQHEHPTLDDMTADDILACDECARIALDATIDPEDRPNMTIAAYRDELLEGDR